MCLCCLFSKANNHFKPLWDTVTIRLNKFVIWMLLESSFITLRAGIMCCFSYLAKHHVSMCCWQFVLWRPKQKTQNCSIYHHVVWCTARFYLPIIVPSFHFYCILNVGCVCFYSATPIQCPWVWGMHFLMKCIVNHIIYGDSECRVHHGISIGFSIHFHGTM